MITKEIVKKYTDLGFYLFPVRSDNKRPLTEHGFQDASNDYDTVVAMFEEKRSKGHDPQLAIATGESKLFVVDIDVKNDQPGLQTFTQILKDYSGSTGLPPTPVVQTPTGGLHYYFKGVGNSSQGNTKKGKGLGDGIDVRAIGGYVVAPPTVIQDYGEYKWKRGKSPFEIEIAQAPWWIIDLNLMGQPTDEEDDDFPLSVEKMDSKDGEIFGEGERNRALFEEGCRLRALGLSEHQIGTLLVVMNDTQCSPPLDDSELFVILKQTCGYQRGEAYGKLLLEKAKKKTSILLSGDLEEDDPIANLPMYEVGREFVKFLASHQWDIRKPEVLEAYNLLYVSPTDKSYVDKIIKKVTDLPIGLLHNMADNHLMSADTKIVSWEDLRKDDTVSRIPLVEGLLYANTCSIFSSPPKAGKSHILRWILYCVATGRDFWGLKVPKPSKVMYYCCEEGSEDVRPGLMPMEKAYGEIPDGNLIISIGIPNTETILQDMVTYSEKYGIELFVIDPLFDTMGNVDSNSYTEMKKEMNRIKMVAKKTQSHVLAIHHANKQSDGKGNANSMLGSTALRGATHLNMWINVDANDRRFLHSENRVPENQGGVIFSRDYQHGNTIHWHKSDNSITLGRAYDLTPEQEGLLKTFKYLYRAQRVLSKNTEGMIITPLREKIGGTTLEVKPALIFGVQHKILYTDIPLETDSNGELTTARGTKFFLSEDFQNEEYFLQYYGETFGLTEEMIADQITAVT